MLSLSHRHKEDERKCAKVSRNSIWESEKLFVREAFSEVMAAKEKKKQLFDLCKKAAAIKQIKIASSTKDRKKLLEE